MTELHVIFGLSSSLRQMSHDMAEGISTLTSIQQKKPESYNSRDQNLGWKAALILKVYIKS